MAAQISRKSTVYAPVYSREQHWKHESSTLLTPCGRSHLWRVYSPHKEPAMWKRLPCHDIISITTNYHLLPIHIRCIRDWIHYRRVVISAYSYLARWYQRLAIGFVIRVIVAERYTIYEVSMSIWLITRNPFGRSFITHMEMMSPSILGKLCLRRKYDILKPKYPILEKRCWAEFELPAKVVSWMNYQYCGSFTQSWRSWLSGLYVISLFSYQQLSNWPTSAWKFN